MPKHHLIYVRVRNFPGGLLQPVKALHLGQDLYKILESSADHEHEEWEFLEGDIVRCEEYSFSKGEVGLLAVEKALPATSVNTPSFHQDQSSLISSLGDNSNAIAFSLRFPGTPIPGTPFEGGIYAGVMTNELGEPAHHLIVATGPTAETTIQWGPGDIAIHGANSEWDGQANSQAIIEKKIECPAVEFCVQSKHEGYEDWYLPSRYELALCNTNISNLFAKMWYWSSTQYSDVYAWQFGFHNGTQSYATKWTNGNVRLVRRCPVVLPK